MPETPRVSPFKVFLSYSHEDEELCNRFLKHLSQLQREGLIEPWNDRRITAGTEWAGAIDENLNSADVIILLVSANLLGSEYCNDVEMTRALERREKGEALVVPVILKPCDWETSRFGRLQALPQGGRPVVDWRTEDHGFLDAVKALRRMIIELCSSAPVRAQVRVQAAVRRHPWRWGVGLVLAAVVLASWRPWSVSRHYLNEGTNLLNVGLYSEAQPALAQARKLNPLSRTASCGLKTIELDALRSKPDLFDQSVQEANNEYPHCAYMKMLNGDRLYATGDLDGALAEYQEAVKREPQLAEAYFNMGRILRRRGDLDAALNQYQAATQRAPRTSRYHSNLADLYFRLGNYDKAIEEYGRIVKFPLSALEAAKIYRLQNKLDDALGREADAIKWLKQDPVKLAEEQYAWALDAGADTQVRLDLINEKECYAELEFAVTKYLQGDEVIAADQVPTAFEKCSSRQHELKDILNWELHRLGSEVPELTQRSDKFVGKFLGLQILGKRSSIQWPENMFGIAPVVPLIKERGSPAYIRSDNGVPFASAHALFNPGKLAVWWLRARKK